MINEQTYKEIKRRIRSFVVLNNGYQFDDLFHDTLEKLIKSKKTNKECIGMCTTVAVNILRDHHNKRKRYKEIQLSEVEFALFNSHTEERTMIIEPLNGHKSMFVLRYKLGLKYKEISNHLDIPLGTTKVRIHKMKKELRRLNA